VGRSESNRVNSPSENDLGRIETIGWVCGTIFELGSSKTLPEPVRFHSGSSQQMFGSRDIADPHGWAVTANTLCVVFAWAICEISKDLGQVSVVLYNAKHFVRGASITAGRF
jgi:hypothetical protein